MQNEIIVLKLGSSVLETQEDLPNAVHEIYRWYRTGSRVVAVVSAIGETTDHLVAQSLKTWNLPDPWASAELLATGERASAALLGVALDRSGVPARIVDPREVGLMVAGSPRDSEPISLDARRFHSLLASCPVVVIPGFFGVASDGRVHLLGRGGSDLSAVFLANRLGAALCRLVKDVDGIYDADPALVRARVPQRFAALNHADALRVAGRLIQPKAVSYLQAHGTCADVAAPALPYQSRVHGGATELAHASVHPPSRVLILGLGTVGFGVYQRLAANPEHFRVEAALVRNRAKYEALGVPGSALVTESEHLRALRPDVVVDALPGGELSRRLVAHFLATGLDVVSANKTLIAECGDLLAAAAARSGATLRYSASVGGSTPMIESLSRIAAHDRPASLAAVLNGTCNFVLDCCSDGATLEEALDQARQRGFAEDDPSDDLSGRDAARKLRILVRHAFGARLERIEVEALDESIARQAQDAAAAGMRLRQISRASTEGDRVAGWVRFERVATDSALGSLTQERNGLEIMHPDGRRHFVAGRGAGRWPTTEAVMADLFDARRQAIQISNIDPCKGISRFQTAMPSGCVAQAP